jgi:HPt (histidine-containing phosphotransfer) domain-containing protein
MTAHALVEERENCLNAGMVDRVTKPVDPEALLTTLLRWARPRPAAEEAIARPAKAVDEITLPEIAGVDVAGGIKRVAGNKRLYRDLLLQFVAKQADAPEQILAAIDSGDMNLAERLAHTVKGVAGNLGLGEVFSVAEKLEKAIRREGVVDAALMEEFSAVIDRQVGAIRQAMEEVKGMMAEQTAAEAGNTEFDAEATAASIARLKTLLEACDGEAAEAYLEVERALAGTVARPHLDALNVAINEFDFEAAIAELDKVAETACAQQVRG